MLGLRSAGEPLTRFDLDTFKIHSIYGDTKYGIQGCYRSFRLFSWLPSKTPFTAGVIAASAGV
jgi:hypothetical protein